MFHRTRGSFQLVRASAGVLVQDKRLLLFPAVSVAALLLVMAAFALPLFGWRSIDGLGEGGLYSVAFLFYVIQYAVIFYFNTALAGTVMARLDGRNPTLADGLRLANARLGTILGFAVISATVGVVLRAIQERVGFLGRLVAGLLGAGWAVATFLVVPVIAAGKAGPFGAVAESTVLLKRTWGENVLGQTGLGAAFGLVYLALACATGGWAMLYAQLGASPVLFLAGLALLALVAVAAVLAQATLTAIYAAVLYRFAAEGSGTYGFEKGDLAAAFVAKR